MFKVISILYKPGNMQGRKKRCTWSYDLKNRKNFFAKNIFYKDNIKLKIFSNC